MSSSTDPFAGQKSERKESDMENGKSINIKNAVSLTDEEMEQFTGGRSKISSMSPLPPHRRSASAAGKRTRPYCRLPDAGLIPSARTAKTASILTG